MKTHANTTLQTYYATKVKLLYNCFSSEYCHCYFFNVCIYLFIFKYLDNDTETGTAKTLTVIPLVSQEKNSQLSSNYSNDFITFDI